MTNWREKTALALFLITVLGFIALRIIGQNFFVNNWSFLLWQHQPWWYSFVWIIFFATALVLTYLKSKQIAEFFNSKLRLIAGLLAIVLLLVLFHFDSILFAGGNLRVAQIAQTEYVVHRWFEFGSSFLVNAIYELFILFNMATNSAAVFAWETLLWFSVLLSLWGSILLTGELAKRSEVRFWLFLIIFFGPQTLAYLGLLGPNVILSPVIIWLALFAYRAMKNRSIPALVMVWLIFIVGIFFSYLCAFLFPAVVYVTLRSTLQLTKWSVLTVASTLLSLTLVTVALFYFGSNNLEMSQFILFGDGKNPFADYGILSERHLSDMAQILFLVFPQMLVVLFLYFSEKSQAGSFFLNGFAWLLFFVGAVTLAVVDYIINVVVDLPRMVVFLTSAGILAACVVRLTLEQPNSPPRLPALLAVLAVFVPLSFAPVFSRIGVADSYVSNYIEKNNAYYITSAIAFRDAYFYKENYDKANEWDQFIRIKSGDYLGFTGAKVLIEKGEYDGAAEELYRLKTKYPYWTEPRSLLTQVQLTLGRYERAKAELDTLLMLEPYKPVYHNQVINYYLITQNYLSALNQSNKSLKIFPGNKELLVNKMTALYRNGDTLRTDSLARELIRIDSSLAYPYLFRAIILDRDRNPQLAARNYEKFLKLSPDSPEAPEVRKRLNSIVLETEEISAELTN